MLFRSDEHLVEKVRAAAACLPVSFVGLVGTPVPAIIATDFRALCRMIEKNTSLPAIAVRTDGTHLYDRGAGVAYDALVREFAAELPVGAPRSGLGVLGLTPLDFSKGERQALRETLCRDADGPVLFFDKLEDFQQAAKLQSILAVSPSGLKAARRLGRQADIPVRAELPPAFIRKAFATLLTRLDSVMDSDAHREILIVHQQVLANALRRAICQRFPELPGRALTVGTFFALDRALAQPGDCCFRAEQEFHRYLQAHPEAVVIGDRLLARAVPEDFGGAVIDLPHFALSGRNTTVNTASKDREL